MSFYSNQTIDDLLADPLVQKVMRADGVETGALKGMLSGVAVRLAAERGARSVAPGRALIAFSPQSRPRSAPWRWLSPPASSACEARCGR